MSLYLSEMIGDGVTVDGTEENLGEKRRQQNLCELLSRVLDDAVLVQYDGRDVMGRCERRTSGRVVYGPTYLPTVVIQFAPGQAPVIRLPASKFKKICSVCKVNPKWASGKLGASNDRRTLVTTQIAQRIKTVPSLQARTVEFVFSEQVADLTATCSEVRAMLDWFSGHNNPQHPE